MSGVKGRSGGRRVGSGPKRNADLRQLHELIDARVRNTDWNSIIGALMKKAKQGDVLASRELRAWRFGQIPIAPPEDLKEPIPQLRITTLAAVKPCMRKHVDEETGRLDRLAADELALQSDDE